MESLPPRLKYRRFDERAVRKSIFLCVLCGVLFIGPVNINTIRVSDHGPLINALDHACAADISFSGEGAPGHPLPIGSPLFNERLDGYEFIVGVLLSTLGLIGIVLACWRWKRKDRALLSFGAFCLLWGARTNLSQFLFEPSVQTWEYARWFLTYLVPVPGFIFAEQLLGRGWKSSIRRLWQIAIVLAAVSIIGGIYLATPWAGAPVNNIFAITGLVIILFNLFRPGIRLSTEIRILRVGFVVYALLAIHANISHYIFTGILAQDIEPVGLLILFFCLGYLVARRFFQNQTDLITIERELETARQIQSFVLPQEMVKRRDLEIAARYAPMTTMAGDFYDFLVLDDHRIGIIVADVSGHGVPAALIASMVKIAFVSQTPHASDPARVLAGLNQMLCGKLESDFVTAGYLFIDTGRRTASYAGAGHPPLLLCRPEDKAIREISQKSIILGQVADTVYKNSELKLQKSDRLVLYTDGIVEALNPAGKIYGAERLKEFILANRALAADRFCDNLLDTIAKWSQKGLNGSLDDDLTLLIIDFKTAA